MMVFRPGVVAVDLGGCLGDGTGGAVDRGLGWRWGRSTTPRT